MKPEQIQKMADGLPPSCIGKDHEEVITWLAKMNIAIQQQVTALAAENLAMRKVIDSVTDLDNKPEYHHEGMGCGLEDDGITDRYSAAEYGWHEAMNRVYGEVIPRAEELDFSATDAAISEIEARGVEKFADHWESQCRHNDTFVGGEAEKYAAQLRAGDQGGDHG